MAAITNHMQYLETEAFEKNFSDPARELAAKKAKIDHIAAQNVRKTGFFGARTGVSVDSSASALSASFKRGPGQGKN